MEIKEAVFTVLSEMKDCMEKLDTQDIEEFATDIVGAKRVFVAGAGRALLLLKCFAKRLSHAEISVHVIGETTTPPIVSGDLLIVASCSGKTVTPFAIAGKAKEIGAKLWGITACADSPITKYCDRILVVPGSGYKQNSAKIVSVQPMNNLFEQVLHIALDIVSWLVQEAKGISNSHLCSRHANIE